MSYCLIHKKHSVGVCVVLLKISLKTVEHYTCVPGIMDIRSNEDLESWRIRLDQINCFNCICGQTDLIISALVIFEKTLSGFLSSSLIIQDTSMHLHFTVMHVKTMIV